MFHVEHTPIHELPSGPGRPGQQIKTGGIDYLQVFETPDGARLWFIEDGEGGAITALLPEEY